MKTDETCTSTGAHIVLDQADALRKLIYVPCRALDNITYEIGMDTEGNLLKLDLQDFELQALKGATQTLSGCDVVITEVSLFAQAHEPTILELIVFLDEKVFQLDDTASLSSRRRDGRAHQGDFVFLNQTSTLALDTSCA